MHDEWLKTRLLYLRGLKTPSDYQRLLLLLAEIQHPTPEEERKLAALVRAEKAADRAQKARANAARVVNADKLATRKVRDRELYKSAGLLILAGLVDTRTGRPVSDRGELLGHYWNWRRCRKMSFEEKDGSAQAMRCWQKR